MWDISKIIPYEKNARINDAAVEKIAVSLKTYGWQQPIVVDNAGIIIAGHTRHKAALKLGYKKCPVHVASKLSKKQIIAYRIADNKTSEFATWDEDILLEEIKKLDGADFDISLTGFEREDFKLDSIEDIEIEENYDDTNCEMPIVPDFFESHQCFVVVAHNEIDVNFVREIFELTQNHKSNSGDKKVRKTNVISVEKLRELWIKK